MMQVGITGAKGFIGTHLRYEFGLYPDNYGLVDFENHYFDDQEKLDNFCKKCDVIIHLAALNRHESEQVIYETNIRLSRLLVESLHRTGANPHVIISSSTQESRENLYGTSKRIARELLVEWAKEKKSKFTGLVIPNVFGPFGKPNYNSVVATFCNQIVGDTKPEIHIDTTLRLVYVGELAKIIKNIIDTGFTSELKIIDHTTEISVSELLNKLLFFKETYLNQKSIPALTDYFDLCLFNTFRSYIDIRSFFPQKLKMNNDTRGTFVEIIRIESGGQTSFSTTNPGVTRGNHFHTRKIERFAVIQGKALIQLRKKGDSEVYDFYLDGNEPAFVDMPIWYTHNIKNIGDDLLYTIFWINEFYDPKDADTYFETV